MTHDIQHCEETAEVCGGDIQGTASTGESRLPTVSRECRQEVQVPHGTERDRCSLENHGVTIAQSEPPRSPHNADVAHPAYRPLREQDLREGARRLSITLSAVQMINAGASQRAAAAALGVAESKLSIWLGVLRRTVAATAETFAPRYVYAGRRPAIRLDPTEVAAARSVKIRTNLTRVSGSTPEALRHAAAAGDLSSEHAEVMARREAAGLPLLPRGATDALHISEPAQRFARAPRNARLEYTTAPGSLQLVEDEETGEERYVQPGERWTIDDGSINLVCCVPALERPGDPCWQRWGMCVGRFQFLLVVDHRSRFIPGWSFTARPRDSYRAEDIVATLHNAVREHGAPREIVLEHGVSAAGLITGSMEMLGVRIRRALTPHSKVVESVFNRLWTKLSLLPGQVGRFRGEEEEVNRLLTSVRSGATDPRTIFPDLATVLASLRDVVAAHNAQFVNSTRYGRWIPSEFWGSQSAKWLRPIAATDAWMFAPHQTDPLKVDGFRIQTSVPMLPGLSTQFVFAAEWLHEFHGKRVKLFFNPFAAECEATVVLAEPCGVHKPGRVIGVLPQIDRLARFTRRAMGYGTDQDIGIEALRSHQQALNRHVQATRADGKAGAMTHEIRRGNGDRETAESKTPVSKPSRSIAPAPASQEMPEPDPRWEEFRDDE